MATTKKPPAKNLPAKRPLPAALAQRAQALHELALARLVEQGREAILVIRERRESIADNYFDVGQALITLRSQAIALALGYDDVAAMLRAELDLSVSTAAKLIDLATRVDRSLLRELQQERAAAILAVVDATVEDDTPEQLLARPVEGLSAGRRAAPPAPLTVPSAHTTVVTGITTMVTLPHHCPDGGYRFQRSHARRA